MDDKVDILFIIYFIYPERNFRSSRSYTFAHKTLGRILVQIQNEFKEICIKKLKYSRK